MGVEWKKKESSMKKVWIFLMVTVMGTVAVAVALAQTASASKPDFSGSWKLNLVKSEFGQVPQPTSETNVVTQTGDDFSLAVTQANEMGTVNYLISFKAGGTETPVAKDAFPANADFKILSSKAEWQGNVLVLTQKATYQNGAVDVLARFMLSDDGKVLTKLTNYATDQGEFDTRTIYEKI
jgi:hypothetical protein